MYFLITPYLGRPLIALTAIVTLVIALLTFGKPLLFDRFYFLLLMSGALISFRIDKNIFSVFLILTSTHLLSEIMWLIREDLHSLRYFIYAIFLYIFYKLKYDIYAKVSAVIVTAVIIAEVYWAHKGYPAPKLLLTTYVLTLQVVIRHLFFFRPVLIPKYFKSWKNIEWLNMDYQIYQVSIVRIVLEALFIFEYLIRHIAGYKDTLVIYNLYPYVGALLACYFFWIVLNQSIVIFKKRSIQA